MEYLTFDEYQKYGGKLDETAFNRLSYRAQRKIDRRTFNRLQKDTEIGEPVKRLMYELISLVGMNDTTSDDYHPAIASEGNDGYSVSYASNTIMTDEMVGKKVDALIEEYLAYEKDESGSLLLSCGLGTLR